MDFECRTASLSWGSEYFLAGIIPFKVERVETRWLLPDWYYGIVALKGKGIVQATNYFCR